MESPRLLSKNERDTLEALIPQSYDVLRRQLDHAVVTGACTVCEGSNCPSIRFSVDRTRAEAWGSSSGTPFGGIGWIVPPGPPPPDAPESGSVVFYSVWLKDGWLDSLDVSHFEGSLQSFPPAWTIDQDIPTEDDHWFLLHHDDGSWS